MNPIRRIFIASLFCSTVTADDQISLHFQATAVAQGHGSLGASYSGPKSLMSDSETKTSLTSTLFLGGRLVKGTELYIDPELSAGSGLSQTQGIAAFPNGEIYRVDPSAKPSISRVFVRQIWGFSGDEETLEPQPNQLAEKIPVRRVTLTLGKFSLNDTFDDNSFSHDPRTQFLNWAFMDNGAWDYAADTRGYTWGVMAEWNQAGFAIRLASVAEPLEANGPDLNTNFPQVRGDNLEEEFRYQIGEKPGRLRVLEFVNHAPMGNYRQTLNSGSTDITQFRQPSVKYGFGLNVEQTVASGVGLFSRAGYNDGHTETWAFAEIDQTFSLGMHLEGVLWNRPDDIAGMAFVVNGISQDHSDYLASGGAGFMLGDGALNYGPEEVFEIFYSLNIYGKINLSSDYQFVNHPGYNRDRGPVSVIAARLHHEF